MGHFWDSLGSFGFKILFEWIFRNPTEVLLYLWNIWGIFLGIFWDFLGSFVFRIHFEWIFRDRTKVLWDLWDLWLYLGYSLIFFEEYFGIVWDRLGAFYYKTIFERFFGILQRLSVIFRILWYSSLDSLSQPYLWLLRCF